MKLRTIFLSLSMATLAIQAPIQALPSWANKAVSFAKSNNMALVVAVGFGLHSIVNAYRSYNAQQEHINAQVRTLSTLRALHIIAASYPKGDIQYNHAINQIKSIPVSDFSYDVARLNNKVLKLLEASSIDHIAVANAYTELYQQINTELGYWNPAFEVVSTLPEFVTDPTTYLSLIF